MAEKNDITFDIPLFDQNNNPFGTQHIGISGSNIITFVDQKSKNPVMEIDLSQSAIIMHNSDGQKKIIKVKNISIDSKNNIIFNMDDENDKSKYQIDANTLKVKYAGEKEFESLFNFDSILDIELPSNLFDFRENGQLSIDSLPSQMFDKALPKLGFKTIQSKDGKLKIAKNKNGQFYIAHGSTLIPISSKNPSEFLDVFDTAIGIKTGPLGIKGKKTKGFGYILSKEERDSIAEFILGRPLVPNDIVATEQEGVQIIDHARTNKIKDTTKKVTTDGKEPKRTIDLPIRPGAKAPTEETVIDDPGTAVVPSSPETSIAPKGPGHTDDIIGDPGHTDDTTGDPGSDIVPKDPDPVPSTPGHTDEVPSDTGHTAPGKESPEKKNDEKEPTKVPFITGTTGWLGILVFGCLLISGVAFGFSLIMFILSCSAAATGTGLFTLYYREGLKSQTPTVLGKAQEKTKMLSLDKTAVNNLEQLTDSNKGLLDTIKKAKSNLSKATDSLTYVEDRIQELKDKEVELDKFAKGAISDEKREEIISLKKAITEEITELSGIKKEIEHECDEIQKNIDEATRVSDDSKVSALNSDLKSAKQEEISIQKSNKKLTWKHKAYDSHTVEVMEQRVISYNGVVTRFNESASTTSEQTTKISFANDALVAHQQKLSQSIKSIDESKIRFLYDDISNAVKDLSSDPTASL